MAIRSGVISTALFAGLLTAASPGALAASQAGEPQGKPRPDVEQAVEALRAAVQGNATIERSSTGLVRFIALPEGLPVQATTAAPSGAQTPASKATDFLAAYGEAFGLGAPPELELRSTLPRDSVGMDHVRFQQMSDGVPVAGAELIVHLRGDRVTAANGRTLDAVDLAAVPKAPTLSADEALEVARAAMGRLRRDQQADRREPQDGKAPLDGKASQRRIERPAPPGLATFSTPRLEILNRGFLEGRDGRSPSRLAWFVTATAEGVYEYIWVDAVSGGVLLQFNQAPNARQREIRDAGHLYSIPGTLVRSEGAGATGDSEVDSAYAIAGNWWSYFSTKLGRDSIDGAGQTLVLNVHYGVNYQNAYWTGGLEQMAFGDGSAQADDVVAHEITHGLTQHTANLYYFMQSGGLNEGMSDVFGETVDLWNGTGTDTAGVRWLAGEDWVGVGVIRNMMDPTAFGDPGKVSDPQVKCLAPDGGGVHSNSGLMNHAFALAVDGGTYNGRTVTGLGLDKAALIVYRALTTYFTTSTTFAAANTGLRQACLDLVGTGGITAANCTNLGLALDAVEMGQTWPCDLGGRISGVVTGPGGAPLPNIEVDLYDASGQNIDWTYTDATGAYTTNSGLATGTYYARTYNADGYVNEIWNGLACPPACSATDGTPIAVTAGSTTTGIDFSLALGGRISGRVTGPGGTGLSDVYIDVYDSAGTYVTSGYTDSTGNYTVPAGLPTGSYYARTYSWAGYIDEVWNNIPCAGCSATSGTPIVVTAGSTTSGVDFALALGGRIGGTVTDSVSAPLASVEVAVYNASGNWVTSGYADASGAYISDGGLPSGTYYARTYNSSGYLDELWDDLLCNPYCTATAGTPITVTAPATTTVNFALALGGRISGTITSNLGTPLESVGVQVYDSAGNYAGYGNTDASGIYTTRGLVPGTYYVRTYNSDGYLNELWDDIPCSGGDCTPTSGTPIAVTAGAITSGVDFSLAAGGRIAGRVTGTGGVGLANVSVYVYNSSNRQVSWANTDASGNYLSRDGLPSGTYYARVDNALGYLNELWNAIPCPSSCTATSGTPITVTAGSTTSGIDFALALGGRISGTVTDGVAPLASVSVSIYNSSGSYAGSGYTNSAGVYTSSGLPSGTYYARTSNSLGYLDKLWNNLPCGASCAPTSGTPITVTAGSTTGGVNFALSPGGRIAGTVTDADAHPLASVNVNIYDSGGNYAGSGYTDATGAYISTGLPTGNYFVRTSNSGFIDELWDNIPCAPSCTVTTGMPVSVTVGATTSGINFSLAAGGRISGTVTSTVGGTPLSSVYVSVHSSTGSTVASAYTDATGAYITNAGPPTGTYFARTSNSAGYVNELWNDIPCMASCTATSGMPIHITAGSTTPGIDFALAPGGRIAGRVMNAETGAVIAGATVAIFDAGGQQITAGTTNGSGDYVSASGLLSGEYYARAQATGVWGDTLYLDLPCAGCDVKTGNLIPVTLGSTTSGIDFHMARGGRIAGRVTDTATSAPLASHTVVIESIEGNQVRRLNTDSGGFYEANGLAAGTYRLYSSGWTTYVEEVYDDIPWAIWPWGYGGTPVTVTAGSNTTGIDFALGTGGTITGQVTDEATGLGLPNVSVGVYDMATWMSATTDAGGNYSLARMPGGSYLLAANSSGGYLSEFYQNAASEIGAVPVTVTSGATLSGTNFVLAAGGRVSGTVTDVETGLPLQGIIVTLFDGNGRSVSQATTDAAGLFTTGAGVPTGRYYARATSYQYNNGLNAGYGYVSQCYGGVDCLWLERNTFLTTRGQGIDVTAGTTTTGIDFELQRGGRIEGHVVRGGTTAGISGTTVSVFDEQNRLVSSALTQSDGLYITTAGLPEGKYFVVGRAVTYSTSVFGPGTNAPCSLDPGEPIWACDATAGEAVAVEAGVTTSGIDIDLEPGGAIGGTTRDASTGKRIRSNVEIFDADGHLVGSGFTDFTGSYRSNYLPPGDYYVRSHNITGYVDVTYGTNVPCGHDCVPWAATPVTVVAGHVTNGVDFDLQKGARIRGRVTELTTGQAYAGMEMFFYDTGGIRVAEGLTDRVGHYWSTSSLLPGTYYVKANSRSGYPSLLYGGTVCAGECDPRSGAPVVVTGGTDVTGVDFVLATGVSIADISVAEGTSALFTVSLSRQVPVAVTVQYQTVAGTATAGADFTAISGTLTFPANVSTRTITVPTLQDALHENSETFTLRLTSPTMAMLVDGDGLASIVDDDPVPSLSIGDVSVTEGNSGTPTRLTPTSTSRSTRTRRPRR